MEAKSISQSNKKSKANQQSDKAVSSNESGVSLPKLKRLARQLVMALISKLWASLLGLLLGTSTLIFIWAAITAPTRMQGDLKVAIADFGQYDSSGKVIASDDGKRLSKVIFDSLKSQYDAMHDDLPRDTVIQVWHDSMGITEKRAKIGVITGSTQAARAKAAAKKARDMNADVIIYGNLENKPTGQNSVDFVPEFYVSRLPGALDDIFGPHELGAPIFVNVPIDSDSPVGRVLNNYKLDLRAKTLGWFTIGLLYELGHLPKKAFETFKKAEAQLDDWENKDGKEVLYLFEGREALLNGDYDAAIKAFNQALSCNRLYGRANIGIGNVYFAQAQLPDQKDSISLLNQAIAEYNQALDVTNDLNSEIKAHIGLGNSYNTEGEAYRHVSRNDDAVHYFTLALTETRSVIGAAGTEQHRNLGEVYRIQGDAYLGQGIIHKEVDKDIKGAKDLYANALKAYAGCLTEADADPDDLLLKDLKESYCQPNQAWIQKSQSSLEGGNK